HSLDLFGDADVRLNPHRSSSQSSHLLGGPFRSVPIQVGGGDVTPILRKSQRYDFTKSGSRSRDERDLAGEVEKLSEAMTGFFAHSFFSTEFACGDDILGRRKFRCQCLFDSIRSRDTVNPSPPQVVLLMAVAAVMGPDGGPIHFRFSCMSASASWMS